MAEDEDTPGHPCLLDEGTFSDESFYYILMGHGSRRERVLFAMCQLAQICFLFIIVLPAFGSDLAQGYLDKVSMDDDQERIALFPDVAGYPSSAMDDDEENALDGWAEAYDMLKPQMTIFTLFSVWSEYFANLIPEKSALFQMNGKVNGPRFFAELGMAVVIGFGGGLMMYVFCFMQTFFGFETMAYFVFVPLVPWLGVLALSMAPSDPVRSITFVKLASVTGMINDLMVAVFSSALTLDYPHIAFAIALGLVIVANLDEWIYTWAQNLSAVARVSKELNPALAQAADAQTRKAREKVAGTASELASAGLKSLSAASATVAPSTTAGYAAAAASGDGDDGRCEQA